MFFHVWIYKKKKRGAAIKKKRNGEGRGKKIQKIRLFLYDFMTPIQVFSASI